MRLLARVTDSQGETAERVLDIAVVEPPEQSGIWISQDEIMALPMSGVGWEKVYDDASGSLGTPNISDQDSKHDNKTLAAALVYARTGELEGKAAQAIKDVIGTERGDDWLAISRNLGAYTIAADVLRNAGVRDPVVEDYIASWKTREDHDNRTGDLRTISPFHSGSNASSQEGFAAAAVAAYRNDREMLDWVWDTFLTFVGDPRGTDPENIDMARAIEYNWTDPDNPTGINPKGSVGVVEAGLPGAGEEHRWDGAIGNDMRRGGHFQWPPGWTQYPWTGMAGIVPCALVLHRAGYPAFSVMDNAVLRAAEYLWFLRESTGNVDWFDGDRGGETAQLVNHIYGTAFPADHPVTSGHTIAYTDWTHG